MLPFCSRFSAAPLAIVMSLLAAITIAAGGCSAPVASFSDPDAFARNLFRIAEEGSASEWGTQLSAARRAEPGDYVQKHFVSWQRMLLELKAGPYGGDLSRARFRIVDAALEFEAENAWHHLLRVTMEEGAWKINQD